MNREQLKEKWMTLNGIRLITSQGMGESDPVAPNDTTEGRALNRRVEIVIAGEAIGIPVGSQAG